MLAVTGTAWQQLHVEDCEAMVDDAYDDVRRSKSGCGEPGAESVEHLHASKNLRRDAWRDLKAAKAEHRDELAPLYQSARNAADEEARGVRFIGPLQPGAKSRPCLSG